MDIYVFRSSEVSNSLTRAYTIKKLRSKKSWFNGSYLTSGSKNRENQGFPHWRYVKKSIREYLMTRDYEKNEPLFRSRKGKEALKRQQAYRIINEAARAVGIKERIGTHTLRKTFGYHAYQSGVDFSILQKLFNHSASSVTLAYIGMTQDDLDNVYLNLNL
ncbi:tyrosine-type recombinase/integrase [Alteribacillus sp. HJP-4]|uniref:tyrosine-type recombinase/integrase n=1 Tax=Alteribacillus sp. HJP-4 TaxID=2775394 RepID=UPI0035CCCAC3